ncbi:unnamed protein product [Durusdinium trenchii]|uniref:Deleted in lung and esophageal cancer protein 1 n=1 Tax=Durusdinium trenchii TaxID=1381693 RepID=A0ABP0KN23_9DINO
MLHGLAERIRQLQELEQEQLECGEQPECSKSTTTCRTYVWVIVESCRDCATHDSTLRHDETQYQNRFEKLKILVLERFPQGVRVELLVPLGPIPEERQAKGPSFRIGSFEVYLCCDDPLKPWGATPLNRQGDGCLGLCISSKLKSRAWPSMDAVMKRMAICMPEVPVQVTVQNALEFPLPFVSVTVLSDGKQVSKSLSDQAGSVKLSVPLYAPIELRAERGKFMEPQSKTLQILAPETHLTFTTETSVQLWQLETAKELVVFGRDPRMDLEEAVLPIPNLVPFQGSLEYSSGEAVRADLDGFIRSAKPSPDHADPLADADFVSCAGWRSSPLKKGEVHGTGRLVEIGRLGTPIVEVSLVTCCCLCPVPNARISVNGEHFGITDVAPVSCGVRVGEHSLLVEHNLLSAPGLCLPLNIADATTCGVTVEFPLDRLRFVCTAAPGTRAPGRADLWLVGGDLAQWRCSRGAPPMDAEVWLWDGELGSSLKVQAGALNQHDWSHMRTDEKELEERVSGLSQGGTACLFSQALTRPCASIGPWQVALHCANTECSVLRLACLATGDVPALWLACLMAQEDESADSAEDPLLRVHSPCCSAGAAGVAVSLNGKEVGVISDHGELKLPMGEGGLSYRGPCMVRIEGVPPCLLPGSTNEYVAHFQLTRQMDLELTCLLWIYWWRPEPEEEGEEEDAMVFVCANVEQIPDEAKPVVGRLCCLDAEEPEMILDGQSVGPILLRRSRLSQKCESAPCLVSQVTLDVAPPASLGPGVRFVPRGPPSPLQLRYEELGGCELQRLMCSPVVLGDLKRRRSESETEPTYEDVFETDSQEHYSEPAASMSHD